MCDKPGQRFLKLHEYQVTKTELELLTGLRFPKILYDTNPLYFHPHKGFNELPEGLGIPQNISKKNYKKYLAFKEKETIRRVKDGQRNLSEENFERMIYLTDH